MGFQTGLKWEDASSLGAWRLQHSMVWIARLDGKEAGDLGTVTICFLTAVTM